MKFSTVLLFFVLHCCSRTVLSNKYVKKKFSEVTLSLFTKLENLSVVEHINAF